MATIVGLLSGSMWTGAERSLSIEKTCPQYNPKRSQMQWMRIWWMGRTDLRTLILHRWFLFHSPFLNADSRLLNCWCRKKPQQIPPLLSHNLCAHFAFERWICWNCAKSWWSVSTLSLLACIFIHRRAVEFTTNKLFWSIEKRSTHAEVVVFFSWPAV